VARRLAAGAALCACLVGALCGFLAAAPADGEERHTALAVRGCEIALEARGSEPVLQLRPGRCAPGLDETRDALRALLRELYPDGRLGAVTDLCLGRIEALPWLSERLAAASLRAPGWDARRGRPRAGSPERFVAELLREQRLAAELIEVLAAFGAEAEIGSVEKVLVREEPDGRVPYDAIVWLRLEVAPAPSR
jgi:hypothetical protein